MLVMAHTENPSYYKHTHIIFHLSSFDLGGTFIMTGRQISWGIRWTRMKVIGVPPGITRGELAVSYSKLAEIS